MNQQNDISNQFGRTLKIWRAEKGMTQADVAEAIGISPQQYQKYEAGSSRLEMSRMFDICSVFGKSPRQLLAQSEGVQEPKSETTKPAQVSASELAESADLVTQAELSFQISEVVTRYMAIKNDADRKLALMLLARLGATDEKPM